MSRAQNLSCGIARYCCCEQNASLHDHVRGKVGYDSFTQYNARPVVRLTAAYFGSLAVERHTGQAAPAGQTCQRRTFASANCLRDIQAAFSVKSHVVL